MKLSKYETWLSCLQELLPCPFCGSTHLDIVTDRLDRMAATCGSCGGSGPHCFDIKEAVQKWNRRRKV